MITRFAPSPTGPLHLGHAYSAILAHDMARAAGGQFLLRIEDIDHTRARPEWEALLLEDLAWLGLTWDAAPMRQSERTRDYATALDDLWKRGLLYPCQCNRRDILEALSAPQEGVTPPMGADGLIYPGTCRDRTPRKGPRPDGALRLDMARAVPDPVTFHETGEGPHGENGHITVSDLGMRRATSFCLGGIFWARTIFRSCSMTRRSGCPMLCGGRTYLTPPRSMWRFNASWICRHSRIITMR